MSSISTARCNEKGCNRIASHMYGRKPYCKSHYDTKVEE